MEQELKITIANSAKTKQFFMRENSTKSSKWQYGKSQICLLCFTEYRKKNAFFTKSMTDFLLYQFVQRKNGNK